MDVVGPFWFYAGLIGLASSFLLVLLLKISARDEEVEVEMSDPILERKLREMRNQLNGMTEDRDFWAATACDYKRDLGEVMRHGPDGIAFKVIPEDKWNRIKEFVVAVELRSIEMKELNTTFKARALLLEIEEEDE